MNNPLVSIVIPVYNREKLIVETIHSGLAQTYSNFEIIVVDNKSTDNTWAVLNDIASKNSKVKVFQNAENVGPVRNWQKGLAHASGEFVKILFSDDLMSPEFLTETMAVFDSKTGFVMTATTTFNTEGKVNEARYNYSETISGKHYIKEMITKDLMVFSVSPTCAIFRKSDALKSLIIDVPNKDNLDFSKYGAGNDLLMFLLTAQNYPKVKIINNLLSHYRHHQNSITVSSEDKLKIYYRWAVQYFLDIYGDTKLSKKFKVIIWKHAMQDKIFTNLNKTLSSRMDWGFFFKGIIQKRIKIFMTPKV